MRLVRHLALFLWFGTLAVQAAGKTDARLLVSLETAPPGGTLMAGLHLRMAPRWHTYWRNAGESGAPTRIEWDLPTGVTAGDILWPVPEKLSMAGLTTYVYHDQVVLLVPLSFAPTLPRGKLELKAKASWLECEDLCVPGTAQLVTTLLIGAEAKPSRDAGLIDEWQKKLPRVNTNLNARAWWERPSSGDSRPVVLEWSKTAPAKDVDFFPFASDNFMVKPATEPLPGEPGKARLRAVVEKIEGDWPGELSGLLIEKVDSGKGIAAYQVSLPIVASEDATAGSALSAETARSLVGWMALAFLGGLILNIMPCVLPVIALKILGFVNQSRESPQQVRKLGLIYALGVLASFLVLAGLVIGVQQAGRAASWGMQFGNPQFLVGMTVLVTLVALNLFGLFEINLGGGAMGAAGELASREGSSGAFFNGVLATALATPCTAPFLASALGFAFAQPAPIIVLMFLMVGLGLAAPYVLLSFQPAWLKFVPKPGAWMEKFKVAMGFPMLATALWLFSLITRHYGKSGVLWVGLFLVIVALGAWIWGEFVQRGSRRRGVAALICVVLLVIGYVYALENQLHWRSPPKPSANGLELEPGGIQWQSWSPVAVEKARAEGRPVFVDFTADWCVTCQANKKTSIEISAVRDKLKAINAVALLGDYTLVPEDITAELKRFQRAGVPLVLVYPKNPALPPIVLPAILTPSLVLSALDKAAQ